MINITKSSALSLCICNLERDYPLKNLDNIVLIVLWELHFQFWLSLFSFGNLGNIPRFLKRGYFRKYKISLIYESSHKWQQSKVQEVNICNKWCLPQIIFS